MTTSAHRLPFRFVFTRLRFPLRCRLLSASAFTLPSFVSSGLPRRVPSFRLSAPVSGRFLFLPRLALPFRSASARFRILSFLFFLSALRRFRLPVAFPAPRSHLSVPPDLPLPCRLVSHPAFRFRLFGFPVCSLSLFPASLPQPFHRCSAFSGFFSPSAVRPCVQSLSVSCFGFPLRTRFRFLLFLSFAFPSVFPWASLRPSTALRFCFHPAFAVLPLRFRPFRIFATQSPFLPFPSSAFRLTVASGLPSALPFAFFAPVLSLRFPAFVSPLRSALHFRSASFPRLPFRFAFTWFFSRPSVPFRVRLPGRLRLRYSVPLLFLSPLTPSPHSGCWCLLAFPLGFRPSPSLPSVRIRFGLLGILIHPEN